MTNLTATVVEEPRHTARVRLAEYAEAANFGDAAAQVTVDAARWAARGCSLLLVDRAVRKAGYDERGRPMIAVARADADTCSLLIDSDTRLAFQSDFAPRTRHEAIWPSSDRRTKPVITAPSSVARGYNDSRALVPRIPPRIRAKRWCRAQLHRYWILWEAEWEQRAPVDPLLLRRIHGGLFTVLAQWALSPVERVVLEAMAEGGAP